MSQKINYKEIKELLDEKIIEYNRSEFILSDPIQVPKMYERKEDIEIAGFLTSTISWGQRKSIIKNATHLMQLTEHKPYEFILEGDDSDWKTMNKFVHRTFNGSDCVFFLQSLKNIYLHHNGLEHVFTVGYQTDNSIYASIRHFREVFLSISHGYHVNKHLSNVEKNSAAKRINMFLRWMVREDKNEVDFGLWKNIPMSSLKLPLDLHTGNISRELGLLTRKQNDWMAVEEITNILRSFDENDPIKYDFALFGMGVFNNKQIYPSN